MGFVASQSTDIPMNLPFASANNLPSLELEKSSRCKSKPRANGSTHSNPRQGCRQFSQGIVNVRPEKARYVSVDTTGFADRHGMQVLHH